MKVLVSGSAGFLGRHMVAALERDGHAVTGWDIADPQRPTDALTSFRFVPERRFDLVIHCAAVAPHRAAIDGKALAVGAGNLELDAAMFQWAARTKPGRVVYLSSSAAYPVYWQQGHAPYELTEDDIDLDRPEQPDAMYGALKLMGERLARAYRQQGGAVTVVRPFSGYGEDQAPDFPFGAFRDRTLRREDPFTVWGNGSQVRDWVHVDDVVGAILAAVDQGVDGPVNLCTGIGTSFNELAGLFAKEAGYSPEIRHVLDAPKGVAYRVGDPTRMNDFYTAKISIEDGVRRALESV